MEVSGVSYELTTRVQILTSFIHAIFILTFIFALHVKASSRYSGDDIELVADINFSVLQN